MVHPIQQKDWTKAELRAEGFRYYNREKQLVMAARLPLDIAPMRIDYPSETVYAQAGDIICFDPGKMPHGRLGGYDYWSIKPEIFKTTYRKWDEPGWMPNAAERHLMNRGCLPYYKAVGVWENRLTEPTPIIALESEGVAIIPPGMWLAIGQRGEPWHIDPKTFAERYVLAEQENA